MSDDTPRTRTRVVVAHNAYSPKLRGFAPQRSVVLLACGHEAWRPSYGMNPGQVAYCKQEHGQ